MVLTNLLGHWLESLDYDYYISSDCSLHQSPRSNCKACLECCPVGAISLEDGKPVIHAKSCIDCGNCVASCPVQAVEGFLPKREIRDNSLIINDNQIPTLKELLVYYKQGIMTIVCEEENISPEWEEAVESANQILEKLGENPFQLKFPYAAPIHDNKISRRELFFGWKKNINQLGKDMTPAKWRFNHKSLDLSKYYPDHQFIDISLNTSKCTLCRVCENLCRKNCLIISETHFTISADQCTNCSLCQDVCPEQAISLTQMISPASPIQHEIYNNTCSNCGDTFTSTSEKDLCLLCKSDYGAVTNSIFAF